MKERETQFFGDGDIQQVGVFLEYFVWRGRSPYSSLNGNTLEGIWFCKFDLSILLLFGKRIILQFTAKPFAF